MQRSYNLIFSWLTILMTLYSLFPFYVITVCLFPFCLFNDTGLTYIKPLKDIWKHTPLLWDAGQYLNFEFSCNRKHRSCEWHSCNYESQKKCLNTKFSRGFFHVVLRFHICLIKYFPCLLSAFLSSCLEECFGAISVWGFWCFTEAVMERKKKKSQPFLLCESD